MSQASGAENDASGGTATPQTTTTTSNDSVSNQSDGDIEGDSNEALQEELDLEPSEVSFEAMPMPDDTDEYDFARLGSEDAEVEATFIGNWKCPYTREFALNGFEEVAEEYVESGDVAIEFRSLAFLDGEPFLGSDAPRATRAGLAVWNEDPEAYWSYFGTVFTNQPQERYAWAEEERLVRLAETADVEDPELVEEAIEGGDYAEETRETTELSRELGVTTVPRVVIDEEITAPTVDFEETKDQIEDAIDD